jgi:hypothetical protein
VGRAYARVRAGLQAIPLFRAAYTHSASAVRTLRYGNRQEVFHDIYQSNTWKDKESRSGTGSNLTQTEAVRRELPRLIRQFEVRTLVDAPCGDFRWLREVDLQGVTYTGIDIVPDLISRNQELYGQPGRSFQHGDIVNDVMPPADLIFCRDCLVHLSFRDAKSALTNFKASGSRYLLTTTFTSRSRNYDKYTGGWRALNLLKPPFNFPVPLAVINEACTEKGGAYADKALALWRLEDLPI